MNQKEFTVGVRATHIFPRILQYVLFDWMQLCSPKTTPKMYPTKFPQIQTETDPDIEVVKKHDLIVVQVAL
jgi:hypothetical protein